jgi:hypothetical protein
MMNGKKTNTQLPGLLRLSRWLRGRDARGGVILAFVVILAGCGGRTGISTDFTAGPRTTCMPSEVETVVGERVSLDALAVDDDGTIEHTLWTVSRAPEGSGATISTSGGTTATFAPDILGSYELVFVALDDDGNSDSCTVALTASALPRPPVVVCPGDVAMPPLGEVELVADVSDDGAVVFLEWSVVEKPSASAALPPTPVNEPVAVFVPDVVGEYVIELLAIDDDGLESRCETHVSALPPRGLRVELYWNPPDTSCDTYSGVDCDSSDVDLHLLHPDAPHWFHLPLDCFFATCRTSPAEWESDIEGANPRLDLDDFEGFGPENINIPEPLDGFRYEIGVHYYAPDRSDGPAFVFLRVYCGNATPGPVYEVGPVLLRAPSDDPHDFWRAASIEWHGESCTVTPRVGEDDLPDIIPDDEAHASR